MKTKINYFLLTLVAIVIFTSCDDDPEPVLLKPTITNVEIGSGNNGIGVIGRDFHLNADIVAGDKIDQVQVKIEPKAGEIYAGPWSFQVSFDQFKGAKNTNVHQHFDIPEDAVEGKYNFVIVVTDENGTSLEETRDFQIVDPANLEVDPVLYIWMLTTDQNDFHYVNETLVNPENVDLTKGEVVSSDAHIKNVKGDGKMYLLLIKKGLNHLPESVDAIDFSKVIVYDVFEHKDEKDVYTFGNVIYDGKGGYTRSFPTLTVGAAVDNNTPKPNPIEGQKAWETGDYYFGVVYTNYTYNVSLHHYYGLHVSGF